MSSFLSKTGIACLTLMSGLTMPSHAAPREAMNILELSHEFTDSTIVFPQSIEANTQTMLETGIYKTMWILTEKPTRVPTRN